MNRGVYAEVKPATKDTKESLVFSVRSNLYSQDLKVSGLTPVSTSDPNTKGAPTTATPEGSQSSANQRSFVLSLNPEQIIMLQENRTSVVVRTSDGSTFTLYDGCSMTGNSNSWTYVSFRQRSYPGRIIVVRLHKEKAESCTVQTGALASKSTSAQALSQSEDRCTWVGPSNSGSGSDSDADSYENDCAAEYVIVRQPGSPTSAREDLVLGMKTTADGQLEVYPDEIHADDANYQVNGNSVTFDPNAMGASLRFEAGPTAWLIEWFATLQRCRPPSHDLHPADATEPEYASIMVRSPAQISSHEKENGITVGAAKIFDARALQQMLNNTANQLAGLSVFNGGQISNAVGNLQGISRDTSYINAQLTTAPTVGSSQSASTGLTSPNTVQTTNPVGVTNVTLQCPDGSLPTIGTSTTLGGCQAVPVTGTTANVPAYMPVSGNSTMQGALTTSPAGSTVSNTGSTATTQNSSTMTNSSVSGVAPAALTSTALSAPTNVGVGSADILAEQVQLNAQLVSLRLLLQGALSDQFLSRQSTAIGLRRQTTLGFSISLDPPRQFKHAVAEVRIIVEPPKGLDPTQNPVSLMTLLPAEKTYNVAKVTSHQSAFGGGAVIEPVSFGVSVGKSKDRLYLAKDTDTLALQFNPQAQNGPLMTPFPVALHNEVEHLTRFEPLGTCGDLDRGLSPETVVFGWQFRPVLGEDYVLGGQREVFAQLALPGTDLQGYNPPKVMVETTWRDYNPKTQTVGAIFTDTCSSREDDGGVALLSQTHVDDMELSDLGGGQVSLLAKGQFYSASLGIVAGPNTISPRTFDGSKIQVIASAHDLLEAGELTIVDPSGQTTNFNIDPQQGRSCDISASMSVKPYPDGNSRATVQVTLGKDFDTDKGADRQPHPLVMVGDSVYGLKETPYVDYGGVCLTMNTTSASGIAVRSSTQCQYNFIAPTTALRNAQTFLVRDLTWKGFSKSERILFYPSFSSIAVSAPLDPPAPASAKSTSSSAKKKGAQVAPAAPSKALYTISGFDLSDLTGSCNKAPAPPAPSFPCLRIFVGDTDVTDTAGYKTQTDNVATISLSATKAKTVRFQVRWAKDSPSSAVEWALTLPSTTPSRAAASPSFLRIGDSQTVSFTGGSLCPMKNAYTVWFEKTQLPNPTCSTDNTSLQVVVPTAVTKLIGHKELALKDFAGNPVQPAAAATLTIDVVKQ
jgi:hypothetical protein